jgi:type IV pilus assembly protein PilB
MRISDGELTKLLEASGKVTPEQLADAEKVRTETKEPLLVTVMKKKLIGEKDLIQLYAKSIDVPYVELAGVKIPHEVLMKIPERIARKYQAVSFGISGSNLQLAMADPEDFQAADFMEKQIGGQVKIYIASSADIATALDQYQGSLDSEITKAIKDSSAGEEAKQPEVSAKDLAEDAPIAKTVNVIVEYAMRSRASDIHIEPRENVVQIRYRIDGVLREAMTLPRPILPAVVSRIKILANLKIDEHRVPQDGRFKFTLGSKVVALRVSTLPIMDGEKVVMRLLDESSKALTLEELGFEGRSLNVITTNLHKPHGMTLVTGPTGSGKSTTLYSILNLLNTPGVNISTVEDPVEYRINGVNQTQVNTKAGMTFAGGLRALLRQDPNIIMVGEIRDGETADLAVQAALTGHVVLSTLHTNNAATTLPRLLDMGVEPFLIASTVNTVIGQRLVRRLCQTCRLSYVPSAAEMVDIRRDFQVDAALKHYKEMLGQPAAIAATPPAAKPAVPQTIASTAPAAPADKSKARGKMKVIQPIGPIEMGKSILEKIAADPNIINRSAGEVAKAKIVKDALARPTPVPTPAAPSSPVKVEPDELAAGSFTLYKAGPGCADCGNASYQGRMGIYEVLEVNEEISKMIVGHGTSDDIQLAAVRSGMLTMQQDGFLKCLRGLTTIEEILRVTRE